MWNVFKNVFQKIACLKRVLETVCKQLLIWREFCNRSKLNMIQNNFLNVLLKKKEKITLNILKILKIFAIFISAKCCLAHTLLLGL